ncbi:MAG: sensor domain-containing protein [Halolamina sp.]
MTDSTTPGLWPALDAPLDARTYRRFGYLLLTVPLGFAYFLILTVTTSTTLGLAVTLAGPVAFLTTLLVVLALSRADLWITNAVLDTDAPLPRFPDRENGVVDAVTTLILGRDAWMGGLYLAFRAALGLFAFLLLTVGAALSLDLLVAPLGYGDALVLDYGVGVVAIDTLPRALAAAAAGVGTALGTLFVADLLGRLSAIVADAAFAPEP